MIFVKHSFCLTGKEETHMQQEVKHNFPFDEMHSQFEKKYISFEPMMATISRISVLDKDALLDLRRLIHNEYDLSKDLRESYSLSDFVDYLCFKFKVREDCARFLKSGYNRNPYLVSHSY